MWCPINNINLILSLSKDEYARNAISLSAPTGGEGQGEAGVGMNEASASSSPPHPPRGRQPSPALRRREDGSFRVTRWTDRR